MTEDEDTPPPDEEARKAKDAERARWDEFARAIVEKRKEAVEGRKASGIEDVWARCEEHYHGIDDVNRHEFSGGLAGNAWTKPSTLHTPMVRDDPAKPVGATGFVRLTSRYVDAGAAKLGEVTIPVDGKGISMKSTPVPDLIKMKDDQSQVVMQEPDPANPMGPPVSVPKMRPRTPDDPLPPEMQGQPPQGQGGQEPPPAEVPLTVADLAKHALTKAEESAKAAETRIHDWLVECSHAATLRKVEFDMARLGVGVLKGPIPDKRRSVAVQKVNGTVEIVAQEKRVPVTKWIDPWNVFPDPGCGESIHDGDYILEREFLSRGKLEDLQRNEFYIPGTIAQVLAEGPDKVNLEPGNFGQTDSARKKQFTLWHFYGRISLDDLSLTNSKEFGRLHEEHESRQAELAEKHDGEEPYEPEEISESVHARVTLVNDTPIRVTVNPLEKSGKFPYHSAPWRRRAGSWAGVGPAEQLFFVQKLMNGLIRSGMTNQAKSSDPLIGIDDLMMDRPARFVPGMFVGRNSEHGGPFDIRAAMSAFLIPNTSASTMQWVELAFRLAEESTNIPLITQGQSGDTTPDTFGGQQLQDNNANQLLRDVGYSVAENISNPLGQALYEWLLLDPDVPESEKGDHQIDANASIALIEKALQDQALMLFAPMTADPGYGFDKRKVGQAFVRAKRWAPSDLMLSDEEFEKQQSQPPPPPPQIAAAQIRAESALQIAQSRDQLQAQRNAADVDRDTQYNATLAERERTNRELGIKELELKVRLAELNYLTARENKLDDKKTDLSITAMELRAQKELAGADGKGPQVREPRIEPQGRAKEGEAFQA